MKKRSMREAAEEVMTRADMEGLRVKNVVDGEGTGAKKTVLLVSEIPPGKAHVLHRHPNSEQVVYALEGSCLHLTEGEPVRLEQDDVVFIEQGEWHGLENDTDRPAKTLVVYAGAGSPEEAGYELYQGEYPTESERGRRSP